MIFKYLAVLLALWPAYILADDMSITIKAEQWDSPRHGEELIKQAELGRIVNQWLEHPDYTMEVRYPGGEEGELWVQELMDWLVALGIPSGVMQRVPGSGAEDIINLVLVQGKKKHE